MPKHRPKFRRSLRRDKLVNKNLKRFWMNNKTIIEFGFRMMWRIMHISEDVLVPLRPSASVNNILLDQNSSHCFIKPPQIPRNRSFSPLSRIVSLGHLRQELPLACMAWRMAIGDFKKPNQCRKHVHSEGPHCSRVTAKEACSLGNPTLGKTTLGAENWKEPGPYCC